MDRALEEIVVVVVIVVVVESTSRGRGSSSSPSVIVEGSAVVMPGPARLVVVIRLLVLVGIATGYRATTTVDEHWWPMVTGAREEADVEGELERAVPRAVDTAARGTSGENEIAAPRAVDTAARGTLLSSSS